MTKNRCIQYDWFYLYNGNVTLNCGKCQRSPWLCFGVNWRIPESVRWNLQNGMFVLHRSLIQEVLVHFLNMSDVTTIQIVK